jgi:surfactin synthase thioesterase subunit
VIFTSGSTGEPKGVQISHQAALNTIDDLNRRYAISTHSRGLAVSALDFDLSVYDLFGLLGAGGSLVLVGEEQHRDAAQWAALIQQHQVNLWNSVPVLLDMLLVVAEQEQASLPLKQVMLSGDWIGLDLPARLHRATQEKAKMIAMGGATEVSIWSNVFDVPAVLPANWTSIPYGQPLGNQQYRVVDEQGRDCPDWVAGELWIGGAGVADGYRGAPELTAQRFVEYQGNRWYRTGDRGRYWPDGNLEFLGRLDHQVKVRGHRIELGEIETALGTLPGVQHAVAVTIGTPASLAAALVLKTGFTLDLDLSRQQLSQTLPEYMVPGTLVILDELPLSANGKVDRKQLVRRLEALQGQSNAHQPPLPGLESDIAHVWQAVLKRPSLSRHDDFFAIGGDSLSATRIVAALHQRVGAGAVSLRILYGAAPTVASLAAHVRAYWEQHPEPLTARFSADDHSRELQQPRPTPGPACHPAAWLRIWQPRPLARRRLICLAHAGGAASFFRPWVQTLAADIELVAVQYPGREERINETLLGDLPALVDGIAHALALTPALLQQPYALFGHSMGAAVAHELYLNLQRRGLPLPEHLLLSACEAPSRRKAETFHQASDQQLKDEVFRLGGTDAAMAQSVELLDLVLPVIRSDYQAIETYRPSPERPRLAVPITVLTGDQFEELDIDDALAWAEETQAPCVHTMFSGGHFYLTQHVEAVIKVIEKAMNSSAKAPDTGRRLPTRVVARDQQTAK